MFHYECCMQWIDKGNDHCPYCRKDMMTKDELFEAAKEELGEARVDKLKKVNVEAAQRLAAFHAANGIAHREGERLSLIHPPAATRQPSAPSMATSQQAPQENNDSPNVLLGTDAEDASPESTTLETTETSPEQRATTSDAAHATEKAADRDDVSAGESTTQARDVETGGTVGAKTTNPEVEEAMEHAEAESAPPTADNAMESENTTEGTGGEDLEIGGIDQLGSKSMSPSRDIEKDLGNRTTASGADLEKCDEDKIETANLEEKDVEATVSQTSL
jgi:hypothetical protein